MEIPRSQIPKQFYHITPDSELTSGDIWQNLPSFGLFTDPLVSGILITPACDLAWSKTETITYLPIISIEQATQANLFYSQILEAFKNRVNRISKNKLKIEVGRGTVPTATDIEDWRATIDSLNLKTEDQTNFDEFCQYWAFQNSKTILECPKLQTLLGERDSNKLLSKLITNSASSEFFFLPQESESTEEWTAVKEHSLVYFRCPLSLPYWFFDLARQSTPKNWSSDLTKIESPISELTNTLHEYFPVNSLRLKSPYYEDLLSRYLALFNRIGTPDFTDEAKTQIISEFTCK